MTLNLLKLYRIPIALALLSGILYGVFAYDLVRSDFVKLFSLIAAQFYVTYKLIKMYGFNFWLLAGMGVLFRLIFLPAIPNLSQDFYRFIWDGRLLLLGYNPYLFTPQDFLLLPEANQLFQADILYKGMGELNGSHYSNYPPMNQLCFAIAAFFTGKSMVGSAIMLRLLIILADLGILYFGRQLLIKLKLPSKNIFWYFLNPFIIIELTGNLHFEAVMLFFLVWSLYLLHIGRWFWAAVLLGISISVKLLPLLFLPIFYNYFIEGSPWSKGFWKLKKFAWVTMGTVALSFAPFLSSQFISNFASTIGLWFQNFEFNASIYYIIRWIGFRTIGWNIIETVGKILPVIVIAVILMLSFFRRNKTTPQLITAMLLAVCCYFLLSTTVHPWYVATPVILCIFTRYTFPLVWSLLVMLSYSAYGLDGFSENLWLVALEYTLVIGFAIYELRARPKLTNTAQLSN